ncbi:MAG: hypothetical protein AAB332_05830 [Planctomycetota bacterium]
MAFVKIMIPAVPVTKKRVSYPVKDIRLLIVNQMCINLSLKAGVNEYMSYRGFSPDVTAT